MISTKLFYPELIVFLALTLAGSCAHSPHSAFDAVPTAGTYSEKDWMSGDDQADYVRRENRTPTDQKTAKKYKISGSCGGFPRVDLKTAPGFCVGLVYDGSTQMKKLRWATVLSQSQFLLVDMGGWGANNGRIYKATIAANGTTSVGQILGPPRFSEQS